MTISPDNPMQVPFKPIAGLCYHVPLCDSRADALDLRCSKRAAACGVLAGCLWGGELAARWPPGTVLLEFHKKIRGVFGMMTTVHHLESLPLRILLNQL